MNTRRRALFTGLCAALTLSLSVAGCGPSSVLPGDNRLSVEASISSVTLADDCMTAGAARPGSGAAEADCAPGVVGGCGFCRQSSMQLRYVAGVGSTNAYIAVTRVRLLDFETGAALETLTSREPSVWTAGSSTFSSWSQSIEHDTTLNIQYKLSAPNWGSHPPAAGTGTSDRFAYGRRYRLEVTLTVDGVARTITSSEIMREPEIAT